MADISIAVVLLDTDPYHAMTPLIKIALSQFSEDEKTNNTSQELLEQLHKLSPCRKLLTTKSSLAKITTENGVRVHHKEEQWGKSSPSEKER